MSIFDKWNASIDCGELQKGIDEASKGGRSGDYSEVPVGTYECKIEKMEIKESSKGDPMVSVWMRILQGDFKNNLLFMNQVINQGFQIHLMNQFLRSLESGREVEFKDYAQYNNLIMDIHEAIYGKLEYLIEYKKTTKGFSTYTVKEVYEV